ncbi:hypothetical protein [Brachybacterium paraconglomeratum]|uniref:hypothetical protein n=1 Tax=Brachybacterium paraconglomeratum TaxID=173362 RepID=UPI0022B0370E|nr:hypothetical protein [Brachybacterium paraconglomeratum]MCZ4325375.1 hypothetical protein [Brachybacterium paraconglomeratum]
MSGEAPAEQSGGSRLLFVDWARSAAYVLMVIAHVAPGDGPDRILLVSEFLTAPLFALLVGVGAQLSWSASGQHGWRYVLREVIRAALVIVLGLLLAQSAASVLIVLVHLGVLMLLCLPLVRLRMTALAAFAALALLLAVGVPGLYRGLTGGHGVTTVATEAEEFVTALGLIGGIGGYRMTGLLLCAVLGMLAIRALQSAKAAWWRGALVSAGAFAVMLALLVAPNLLGLYEVHAYDGTPSEQIGVASGALGVLLAMWALERSPLGRALPSSVAQLLAAPGQAALTLYALQILVLHVYQVNNPLVRDDHWWMLALLIALGVGFAMMWQAVLAPLARRIPSARPWVRGPLEGLIRGVQDLLMPRPVEALSSAGGETTSSHRTGAR